MTNIVKEVAKYKCGGHRKAGEVDRTEWRGLGKPGRVGK